MSFEPRIFESDPNRQPSRIDLRGEPPVQSRAPSPTQPGVDDRYLADDLLLLAEQLTADANRLASRYPADRPQPTTVGAPAITAAQRAVQRAQSGESQTSKIGNAGWHGIVALAACLALAVGGWWLLDRAEKPADNLAKNLASPEASVDSKQISPASSAHETAPVENSSPDRSTYPTDDVASAENAPEDNLPEESNAGDGSPDWLSRRLTLPQLSGPELEAVLDLMETDRAPADRIPAGLVPADRTEEARAKRGLSI